MTDLISAVDALSATAPKPEQGETEPQSWPCRECVENKNGRCETAGMPIENERDEEYCPDFTRRMPVVADCAVCRTKGYCPPDCTGHAPSPAALKGTDQ